MRAAMMVGGYLAGDLAADMVERPLSTLAKGVTAWLLAVGALGVLYGFGRIAGEARAELVRLGADTVYVTSTTAPTDGAGGAMSWLDGLPGSVRVRVFQRLAVSGTLEMGGGPGRFGGGGLAEAWVFEQERSDGWEGFEALPALIVGAPGLEGRRVRVFLDEGSVSARVAREPRWWGSFGLPTLLVAAGGFPGVGFDERLTPIARAVLSSTPGEAAVLERAITELVAREGLEGVRVTGPTRLVERVAALEARLDRARVAASLVSAVIVGLVLGSTSLLEAERVRYVSALLRSWGVRRHWIVARQAVQYAAIVGMAYGLAVVAFAAGRPLIDRVLGGGAGAMPGSMPGVGVSAFDLAVVGAAVSVGVLAAAIGVVAQMGRDVGEVLR